MILNNPEQSARYTYPFVWWDGAFTEEELERLRDYCAECGVEQSLTVQADEQAPNTEIRRSQVRFHFLNDDTQWIFQRFNNLVGLINDRFYQMDLTGYEMFQYGEYSHEEGGKYDWHMDCILGDQRGDHMQLTRKLSLVMLLNDDFTGGEFEMNNATEATAVQPEMQAGRVIAFPSWMIHRVKPVLTGVRKSIVIWVMGPKFS